MPNNNPNLLIVRGNDAKAIISNYLTEKTIDFQKIIPRPKELDIEDNSFLEIGVSLIRYEHGFTDAFDRTRFRHTGKTDTEIYNELNKNSKYWEFGEIALRNIARYGHSSWYSWNLANWGTKWSAYQCSILKNTKTEVRILFDTAWSPPFPIFRKLVSFHPELKLDVLYCDEGGCYLGSCLFHGKIEQDFQYKGRKGNAFLAVLGHYSRKVHKYKRLTPHERLFLYAE